MLRGFLFILISIYLCGYVLAGEWNSTELCTINWDGEGYTLFSKKALNNSGTPDITSDDYIQTARGPEIVIVDMRENIIIFSDQLRQLVGFDSTGELIFNFSYKASGYRPDITKFVPRNIYVDSLSRLYIQTSPAMDYMPVVNYDYEILDKIQPFPGDPHAEIWSFNWAPDGTLFFRNPLYGWVTYADGKSSRGGSDEFRAADGYFYNLFRSGNNTLTIDKSLNPDRYAQPRKNTQTDINLRAGIIVSVKLLAGGDGNFLYMLLNLETDNHYEIWQYDLKYKLDDKLVLPDEPAYEEWRIDPFVRRDGNIYEFRTREEGMQVVKWSKE